MRLFVALDMDEAARRAVAALHGRLARRLDAAGGHLRWVPPGQLHLTLAFIGDVDAAIGAAVLAAMTPPFAERPFVLALGGLGMFPPRGAPRVLWIGSTAGGRETIDLQRAVADRLSATGVALDERPFHAHLTLGRWRASHDRDRRAVADLADTGELARVEVDHVTLYESHLSPAGATHEPLVTPRLAGR